MHGITAWGFTLCLTEVQPFPAALNSRVYQGIEGNITELTGQMGKCSPSLNSQNHPAAPVPPELPVLLPAASSIPTFAAPGAGYPGNPHRESPARGEGNDSPIYCPETYKCFTYGYFLKHLDTRRIKGTSVTSQ